MTASYEAEAAPETLYDRVDFPSGAVIHIVSTNATHATIAAGAQVTVGSGAISGSNPNSLAVEARDETNVGDTLTDTATPRPSPRSADRPRLPHLRPPDRVDSFSRDTQVRGLGPRSGDTITAGGSRASSQRTPAPSRPRSTPTGRAGLEHVSKDDAIARVGNGSIEAEKLTVEAWTETTTRATAKAVDNDVTGDTKATVVDADLDTLGSGGLAVQAQDDSTLTALATNRRWVPTTPS